MLISFSMSSTPTIFDVAKAAGTSPSAVSFVLNGKADKYRISPATQARIRATITQLGFQPNQVAIGKAHGEHHPIEVPPVEPVAPPVVENTPLVTEVEADVPAASAPEPNLDSSTPVFVPEPAPVVEPPPAAPPSDFGLNNQEPDNSTTASPEPTPEPTPETGLDAEIASPVSEITPEVSLTAETVTENIPAESKVDADVPAASATEPSLDSSTPEFVPEPTPVAAPPPPPTPSDAAPSTPAIPSAMEPIPEPEVIVAPTPEQQPVIFEPTPAPEPVPATESELKAPQEETSGAQAELGNTTESPLPTPSADENPTQ